MGVRTLWAVTMRPVVTRVFLLQALEMTLIAAATVVTAPA